MLAEKKAEKEALQAQLQGAAASEEEEEKPKGKEDKIKGNQPPANGGVRKFLGRFFGLAPLPGGADNDF